MKRPRVAVVGSVNMDLVIHAPRLPAPGETVAGHGFCTLPGGKGANQAVAAARMGAEVHFVGAVGGDGFGRQLARGLADEGIVLEHLGMLEGEATGVAVITLDAQGQNSIVLSPGANGRLTPAMVDAAAAVIAGAQMLVCQLETPLDAVAHAIAIARAHAVPVILNPAPAAPLDAVLLAQVDYLVPNETEAAALSGRPVSDAASAAAAARRLAAMGARHVLITLGENGLLGLLPDGQVALQAAVPVKAVDTTGAGDTFVGSLAAELAAGRGLAEAMRFAQFAAALKVMQPGAQVSIPRRAVVEQFMQDRPAV